MLRQRGTHVAVLLGGAAGALVLYGRLTSAVSAQTWVGRDRNVRAWVQRRRDRRLDRVALATNPTGKWWSIVPAAWLLGLMWRQRPGETDAPATWVLPATAAMVAAAAAELLEQGTFVQGPPPGHPNPHESAYPSGHAFQTTATMFTIAYIRCREERGAGRAAATVAAATLLSVVSPGGRTWLDRHWASDVLGGWLLGGATAALVAAIYEARRVR